MAQTAPTTMYQIWTFPNLVIENGVKANVLFALHF